MLDDNPQGRKKHISDWVETTGDRCGSSTPMEFQGLEEVPCCGTAGGCNDMFRLIRLGKWFVNV